MRLDKFVAAGTAYSRKKVKKLIRMGAVTVDGKRPQSTGSEVGEENDVRLMGEEIHLPKDIYIMMNKPQGVVCAVYDKTHRTVCDIVEADGYSDMFPIGRLDIDTEGLLLLTNDGALAHTLISPSKNVVKTYFAVLDKPACEEDVAAFAAGMEFKEFTSKSAVLEICENKNEVYIKISEGKFHQVKRMCARVGKEVRYLKRVAIGGLQLDSGLAPGDYRTLTDDELALLKPPSQE